MLTIEDKLKELICYFAHIVKEQQQQKLVLTNHGGKKNFSHCFRIWFSMVRRKW